MFQFPAFASRISRDDGLAPAGLPHSEIRGSKGICPSPRLIAACHVLLRLREPRHPPYALIKPLFSSRYQVFCGFRLLLPYSLLFYYARLLFFLRSCRLPEFPSSLSARGAWPSLTAVRLSPFKREAPFGKLLPTVCQCALFPGFRPRLSAFRPEVLNRVVLGRVELPTSTLSV